MKNAPKYIRCILWGLVGLRLALPFSLKSAFSLIPSTQQLPDTFLYAAAPQVRTGIPALNNLLNPVVAESLSPAVGASANPTQILSFVCARIWLIGVIFMALYAIISYLIIKKNVNASIAAGKSIRLCDNIDTPFILGILKPHIYLPSSLDRETAEHVLAHETAHLQRRDHWWKPLGFALLAVYWFNPVMWLAYILLCRDIELACDEKVIRDLDSECKKAYSKALLSCSVSRRFLAACHLAFGEVGVKDRIRSVLNYRKPTFWVITATIAVCLGIVLCFLTDPIQETPVEGSSILNEYPREEDVNRTRLSLEAQRILSESLYRNSSHSYINFKTMETYRWFNSLDAAIANQILGPNSSSAEVDFESHVIINKTVACSKPFEGQTSPCGEVAVQVLAIVVPIDKVFITDYTPELIPVTITFEQYPDGSFQTLHYSQSGFEISDDPSAYLTVMMQEVYDQAARYSALDTGAMISELINTISSSPAQYSFAQPYIDAHTSEYIQLIYHGKYTLQHCFREFLYGNPAGIRAEIMAAACRDIAAMFGEDISMDGQYANATTWFQALVRHTEQVRAELIAKNEEVKAFRYDLAELHPILYMIWNMKYPSNNPMDVLFESYLNLDTTQGLTMYIWETPESGLVYGLTAGSAQELTEEEVSSLLPATLDEMTLILSFYSLTHEDIRIISYSPQHNNADPIYKYHLLESMGFSYTPDEINTIYSGN